MNTRPTYKSIDPVQVGPYSHWNARHIEHHNRVHPRSRMAVIPPVFNAAYFVSDAAVASLHRAFLLAKTSHDAWRSHKREGRFDARRAAGATRLEQDIFKRKTGRSTTKVRVAVLIDASGSMNASDTARLPSPLEPGSPKRTGVPAKVAAAVFGATIVRALSKIPTVAMDVYEHSAAANGTLYIKYRWHKGTPLGVFNESATTMGTGGGNADGHALFAITSRLLSEVKKGERGIIMLISDGMPSVYAADGTGQAGQALIDAVAHARKNGIEVIAVAVDGSDQSVYYGKDGVIPFTGDWSVLGKTLAEHIGKALARR